MWICIHFHAEFLEFTGGAEANIDSLELHFMCPARGRRNRLRGLDEDDDGIFRLGQIGELE